MYDSTTLSDLHERSHRCLAKLLEHCRVLSAEELNRELDGFGYPTIRLQFHHEIAAERYWLSVLHGQIVIDDDDPAYPTIDTLETFRRQVFEATESYLRTASTEELNTPRPMTTWQKKQVTLVPAQIIVRTQTHLFHHQGQILAMCRLLGHPGGRMDYPIA